MPLYNPSGNVISASGNTEGALAVFAAGSVILAGGNNITLSQTSNSISIIGGAGGTGGAAITLGESNLGNTSGTSGVISGSALQFILAGGNNVTLSQSLNGSSITITVSAAAQTNQSGNLFASSNTFGTSSGTYDARSLTFQGSGAVSVAASNHGIVISAPVQSNQQISAFAVSNTTQATSGTLNASVMSFEGAGGVSVGVSNGSIVISGATGGTGGGGNNSIGMSNLGNTAGTTGIITGSAVEFFLAGGNNVTLSQSINGSTATVTISVGNAAGQTNQTGDLFAGSNTFGTSSGTYDARTLSFVGQGAVSVAASNSGVVISAPAYTTITQGNMVTLSTAGSSMTIDAFANILSASGNTSGTLATFSSGTMVLAGGNNITLSQSSNTITISAGAGGGGTNVSAFAVSNTTLSSSGTIANSAHSFEGAGLVSVGISNGSIVISGSAAAQTNQAGSVFAASNTFGTSSGTYDARTLSVVGSGGVSVAASNSGFVVSAPVQSFLIAGNNITLSSNSNSITIAELNTFSQFEPWEFGPNSSASSLGVSSLYMQHMNLPQALQVNRMDRLISISLNAAVSGSTNATGTRSNVWTYNETIGLYTRQTGANSTNLASYMSNGWSMGVTESVSIVLTNATQASLAASYTFGFVGSIDTAGGSTSSTFSSTSGSSSAGTTVSIPNPISNISGLAVLNVPFGSNLMSAGDYWLAIVGQTGATSGGTASTQASISNVMLTGDNVGLKRVGQTATATSITLIPGNGAFTAQTAAFPSTVAINAISNNSNNSLYGNFMNFPM